MIYLYVHGEIGKTLIMFGFGLFIGVVDNFVRAYVLKGREAIHPLVGLVAIFGGIQMFGILGVFLGPILAAVLISLLQIWPIVAQRSGIIPHSRQGPKQVHDFQGPKISKPHK